MSRPYGEKFLKTLYAADERQLGVQLGRLCVRANIPASYVAPALEVTRMTIYMWFRGQDIRAKTRKKVEAMIGLMKNDFDEGILPVKTNFDAKIYIEGLVGIKL